MASPFRNNKKEGRRSRPGPSFPGRRTTARLPDQSRPAISDPRRPFPPATPPVRQNPADGMYKYRSANTFLPNAFKFRTGTSVRKTQATAKVANGWLRNRYTLAVINAIRNSIATHALGSVSEEMGANT